MRSSQKTGRKRRRSSRAAASACRGLPSAGALVGLLSALCLLHGLDPVRALHEGWVERVSFDELMTGGGREPLSLDELGPIIQGVVNDCRSDGPTQRLPVLLHVSLTTLSGLRYHIDRAAAARPVVATTFADWAQFTLSPHDDIDELIAPDGPLLTAILASASHPGAFAPRLVDRERDRSCYERNGIQDLPESGKLWYGDGSIVQSQPIGRLLHAVKRRELADDDCACHVLIDPRSHGSGRKKRWTGGGERPSWSDSLARTLAVLPVQAVYEDVRRVEKMNQRIAVIDRVVRALEPHLGAEADQALDSLRDELGDGAVDGETALDGVLRALAGLRHHRRIEVEVVSPLILSDADDEPAVLAGDMLGDFGGFLSRELRHSDFCLGYDSMDRWLAERVGELLVPSVGEAVLQAVADERIDGWKDVNAGDAGLRDLSMRARFELVRLAKRLVRVLMSDAAAGVGAR